MDLLQEKVDNRLICLGFGSGLILNIFSSGYTGILHFFSGAFFPLLCLLPLFYFRMIGGGDIKLLSALGGIAETSRNAFLISSAIFIAAGGTEAGSLTGEKDWNRKIFISQFPFSLGSFY